MNKLGEIIKKRREALGLSLRDLANITGLSHSYIDKLEKGIDQRSNKEVQPTVNTLKRLQKGLNIPMLTLLDAVQLLEDISREEILGFLDNTKHFNGEKLTDEEKAQILSQVKKQKKD